MNIKILDSWLRDYLKTDAKPADIARVLSLTSVGIERIEKWKSDYVYDIEITTNRPDLASVVGIAREASAVLPEFGYTADFLPPQMKKPTEPAQEHASLTIKNDPQLVNRICAVIMEVSNKPSPQEITDRLESSDIRSLNTVVDITNYVMRTIGYPTHVFDYDRLNTKTLNITTSKAGETITTLDGKEYILPGGDIIARDDQGRIVDLLGIMGLENSVVTGDTKRIVLFINNDDPHRIRKTSMQLGIRTEAAQLNEKNLDPELVMNALLYGVSQYQKLAGGKLLSKIIDIYPNKPKEKTVSVNHETINRMLGVDLPITKASDMLKKLGFHTTVTGDTITAKIPTFRLADVSIPEDLVEEIARIYGYQNIPNILPPFSADLATHLSDEPFYWESRLKQALKYWGFTETYTYPMVSETLYEGDTKESVRLKNPLGEDFVYMRKSLVPSLLQVVEQNKKTKYMRLFEIGNVYCKNGTQLPLQTQHLAIVMKEKTISFFELKGVLEQIAQDIGIRELSFKALDKSGLETEISIGKDVIGTMEILDDDLVNAEVDFEKLIRHATTHASFTPLQKYPPIREDISFIISEEIPTGDVVETIKKVSPLITEVSLFDKYKDSRSFHLIYQSTKKNLTTQDVEEIREKIFAALQKTHKARAKS